MDEPTWLAPYVSGLLRRLDQAGVPPAEVQARLRVGEDLREIIDGAGLASEFAIGLALLPYVSSQILRGVYEVN